MRWVAIGGLYLVLTACTFGTPGNLGNGEFHYECVGSSDPRCDYEFHFDGLTGCGYFCQLGPGPYDETIPGPLAVGSRFSIWFVADDGQSSCGAHAASPEMRGAWGESLRKKGNQSGCSSNSSPGTSVARLWG